MKKRLLKFAAVAMVLGVIVGGSGAATVQMRHNRTFDVPEVNLAASTDSAVIARGAYLVYGPAHCAYCHNTADKISRLEAGEQVPLSGGAVFDIGIAKLVTPNLTPHETGIANISDGKIARMLRHNVKSDGTAAIPFMEFQNMSDEDVVAILSYLRSQPPVENRVAARELRPVGKAIMSFAIGPAGPAGTPPATSPPEGATVERGDIRAIYRYLQTVPATSTAPVPLVTTAEKT